MFFNAEINISIVRLNKEDSNLLLVFDVLMGLRLGEDLGVEIEEKSSEVMSLSEDEIDVALSLFE